MGLGVSGATAIVGLAVVATVVALGSAVFSSAEKLDEARREAWVREESRLGTRLDIVEVKLIATQLYVIADNVGSRVVNPAEADVVLDGVHKTDRVLNWTANGVDGTTVWPPGTRLYVRLDEASVPARAVLVAGNGITEYWVG